MDGKTYSSFFGPAGRAHIAHPVRTERHGAMKIAKVVKVSGKEADTDSGSCHPIQLVFPEILRMDERVAMILSSVGVLGCFNGIEGKIRRGISIGVDMTLKPKVMQFADTCDHLLATEWKFAAMMGITVEWLEVRLCQAGSLQMK